MPTPQKRSKPEARRPGPAPRRVAQTSRDRLPASRRATRAACSGVPAERELRREHVECVQPEPCAAPSGWRSPGISTTGPSPTESTKRSTARARWPPVRTTARGPSASTARASVLAPRRPLSSASSGPRGRRRARAPPGGSASDGRARQDLLDEGALSVGVEQPRARLGDHHRVDHDRRPRGQLAQRARDGERDLALPSMPTLTASTPMSATHRADLSEHDLRRHRVDRLHPHACSER